MTNLLKVTVMLPVVVILLFIKLALLPIMAWQSELLADIEQYEQRNTKAQRLLNSESELINQLSKLSQKYESQVQAYSSFDATEDFHIETKVMIDILLGEFDLKVTRFFWRKSTDEEVFPGFYKARFNVDFTGKLKNFALLQARLGTSEKAFKILNFSNRVRNQSATSMGVVASTLTVETYYWLNGKQ